MSCTTCKQKPRNNISSLVQVNMDELESAYLMTTKMSQMNDDKWDHVIDVYLKLFPTNKIINRKCADCMRNIVKAVEYEYKKHKQNQKENTNGRKKSNRKTTRKKDGDSQ